MKFILLALLVFALSCSGLSKNEKESLDAKIMVHNISAALQYKLAAIDEDTRLQIRYIDYDKAAKEKITRLSMQQFNRNYNEPYDIKKDSTLDLDKYLKYCKAHGYDPVTYIDFMKEK